MKSVYLAGPLFSVAEIKFNLELYLKLTGLGYKVFLPQKECKNKKDEEIFFTCKSGIDSSEIVIAILDGADADSGTCWECGYAFAKNIPVIAVRTDFRMSGDTKGFNAMLFYSATILIDSFDDFDNKLIGAIQSFDKN